MKNLRTNRIIEKQIINLGTAKITRSQNNRLNYQIAINEEEKLHKNKTKTTTEFLTNLETNWCN